MAFPPLAPILLLIVASMLAVSSALSGWDQFLFPSPPPPQIIPDKIVAGGSAPSGWDQFLFPSPPPPQISHNKIVVGGSQNWRFGFDYSDWALKNGPFYVNDTLVFKYDPPNSTTFPHSVYLLPNLASFSECDLTAAQKVANWSQGGGDGFEFVLQKSNPYYFACGERNGFHCKQGTMKFSLLPKLRH